MTLSDGQFDRTRRLALDLAGIELAERHRDLLARRGRRIGIHDAEGLDSLLGAAEGGETLARELLLGLLTTKFTGFFRHPRHFEVAAAHAVEVAGRRGRARLWSAGTATGEEAFSLAMATIEAFGRDDPPVAILATDLDARAVGAAREGEYSEAALESLSPERRERFLDATGDPRRRRVAAAVRALVTFRTLNLVREDWPHEGPFDVILCRNVLMYLAAVHRRAVITRMASALAADGLLLLDPAEHLGPAGEPFGPGAGGVYALRRDPGRADSRLPTTRKRDS